MQEPTRNATAWGLRLQQRHTFRPLESQLLKAPKSKKACLAASLTCKVAGCTGLEPAKRNKRKRQLGIAAAFCSGCIYANYGQDYRINGKGFAVFR